MHEYVKDAIVKAGLRCENYLQLAHIFGHAEWRVGTYYADLAEEQAALAFELAQKEARAGVASAIPTGGQWS